MSRQALVRAALVLGTLGLCVAGFFTCFEKREVEIETEVSAQARRNRYLALGRLLERMGHTVVALTRPALLSELPTPPATLILPTPRVSIGARRSQALLDWVGRGGHLVVVTYSMWKESDSEPGVHESGGDESAGESVEEENPPAMKRLSSRPDFILDRFGLRQVAGTPPESDADEEAGEEAEEAEDPPPPTLEDLFAGRFRPPATEASWAEFDELEEPLEVGFGSDYQWLDPKGVAVWQVAGPSGVHLVELRHGRGRISALTSEEPLSNASIGAHDNAEFIVRWLRRDAAAQGPIWIFYDEDWPSLLALARRHALPVLVAGGALLFAWVWSVVFRFGPVLPEPPPVRRAWLEHLDAAGRFHWRQDRGRALLSDMREEVARRMRERHPAWQQLPEREQAERIAERAGLSLSEVEHALAGTLGGARAFAARVGALERIRAAL